jgi:hypothetical protein
MSKDSENENERLAREWMASENWGGWRVGMTGADKDGYRFVVVGTDEGEVYIYESDAFSAPYALSTRAPVWPDLTHPGTRAFLLEDVRRAWASEGAVNWESGPEWHYVVRPGYQFFYPGALYGKGKTEQAALIAALRAAPEKTK